ncbi:hypothetical protein Q604_UNBC00031G0001, partial [human gut metagenome]
NPQFQRAQESYPLQKYVTYPLRWQYNGKGHANT